MTGKEHMFYYGAAERRSPEPFNPRRTRVPEVEDVAITSERIAAALDEAVEIRRKSVKDPNDVRAIELAVSETAQFTKNKRAPVDWDKPPERTPWIMVGWVKQDVHRELAADHYWEVWLNVDDDRVWLKQSRWSR